MEGKGDEVEPLYGEIKVMKEFNLSPQEWNGLHRWDKLALRYQSLMEAYYTAKSIDEQKQEMKRERDIKKNLPKQQIPKKGRGRK